MAVIEAIKKGFGATTKSLLLSLVSAVILFIGSLGLVILVIMVISRSNFPPVTPDMTPEQIRALDWSQTRWGFFIPAILATFALGFLLTSFIQSGIIGSVKDCLIEKKEKITNFFRYAVKYFGRVFVQLILVNIIASLLSIIGLIIMGFAELMKITPLVITIDIIILLLLLAVLIYASLVLVFGQIRLIHTNSKAVRSLGEAMKFLNKHLLETILLFILTLAVFLACYFAIQGLTLFIVTLPNLIQTIWSLIVLYIYVFIFIFMLSSFIAYYLDVTGKEAPVAEKVF